MNRKDSRFLGLGESHMNASVPTSVPLCLALAIWVVVLCCPFVTWAEGTAQIQPRENDPTNIHISNQPWYTTFAQYGSPEEERLKLRISDTSETIFFGLNQRRQANDAVDRTYIPDIPMRIVSPSGVIVFEQTMPAPGEEGSIATWDQALAGPQELGNLGGYDAIRLDPAEVGDYYIEFDISALPDDEPMNIHLSDFTVVDSLNEVQLGRLHSQGWQFSTESFTNPFFATLYPYDGATAVYSVDFNEMEPYTFVINFNSTGVANSGDILEDRRSVVANSTYPEFEVFLNPPDSLIFPTEKRTVTIETEVELVDCATTTYCIQFTSSAPGDLDGFIDVDNNGVFSEGAGDIAFSQQYDSAGTQCIEWDGLDGNGSPVQAGEFQIISGFGFGVTHLPMFDVERHPNGFVVDIVRPAGSTSPNLYWDDSQADRGTTLGQPLVELEGCDPSLTGGCHTWDDRGVENANSETINTWWYATLTYDTVFYAIPEEFPVQLSFDSTQSIRDKALVCRGDTIDFFVLNDSAHFDDERYAYQWYVNGEDRGSDVPFESYVIDENTEVVVRAIENNNALCVSYDTLRMEAVDPVRIAATIVDIPCSEEPGSIEVELLQGPPNTRFLWQDFPEDTIGSIDSLLAGTYQLTLVDTSVSLRCALDTSFTVVDTPPIFIDSIFADSTPCYLQAGSAEVFMESTSNYLYSWDRGTFGSSSEVSGLGVGEHTISVIEQGTGCEADSMFEIPSFPFDITLQPSPENCENGAGSVVLDYPEGDFAFLWSNGASTADLDGLSAGSYSVVVTATLDSTCQATGEVVVTNEDYDVLADFRIEEPFFGDTYGVGELITLTNLSEEGVSALWEFGDGASATTFDATHQYPGINEYVISLSVTDANGCTGQIEKIIEIDFKEPCDAALPTAFSPNDDNFNDDFGILGNVEVLDLRIFNRWGEVIFRTLDREKRWDGSFRGQEVPIGVYPFTLEYQCPDSEGNFTRTRKVGDVTLVR